MLMMSVPWSDASESELVSANPTDHSPVRMVLD